MGWLRFSLVCVEDAKEKHLNSVWRMLTAWGGCARGRTGQRPCRSGRAPGRVRRSGAGALVKLPVSHVEGEAGAGEKHLGG